MRLEDFWEIIAKHPWMLAVVFSGRGLRTNIRGPVISPCIEREGFSITKNSLSFGLAFINPQGFLSDDMRGRTLWDQTDHIVFKPQEKLPPINGRYVFNEIEVDGKEKSERQQKNPIVTSESIVEVKEVWYIIIVPQAAADLVSDHGKSNDVVHWIEIGQDTQQTVGESLDKLTEDERRVAIVVQVIRSAKAECVYLDGTMGTRLTGRTYPEMWSYDVWMPKVS